MTTSNRDDLINSRDVIAYLKKLESEADANNQDELDALRKLAIEGEQYAPDWKYGETLIRESYFTKYAQDLVRDIGDLPEMADYIVIDWEATARNLKPDYTEIDYDGVAYLIR